MKYVLLVYQAPGAFDALPEEERNALRAEFDAFSEELTASGELIGGAGLADAPSGRTVRVRERRPGHHRRTVRRGQGAAGRLLRGRLREHRPGRRDRRQGSCVAPLGDRGAGRHARGRAGDVTTGTGVEDLLRGLAPQVLGVLIRRHGRFDACEDAVQEALLAAAVQWRAEGVPESPRGWLITVASRRLADAVRSDAARRRREDAAATLAPEDAAAAPAPGDESPAEEDDTLTLLLLCCHPALSPASQLALTLRAVGGLDHGRDRARVPRARGDDGAAHQPRQAADQGRRRPVRASRRRRAHRAAARGPARAVSDVQRGLHGQLRPASSSARS